MLKLLAFVFPLSLDSFAAAAAIGAFSVTTLQERLRISAIFVVFEGGMPVIGLVLGRALAIGIGHVATYLAAVAVIAIGARALRARDQDEDEKAGRMLTSRRGSLLALGISISLDEVAIGFGIGLARVPVTTVIVAIALQAFLATQLGLAIGARMGQGLRGRAEQIAGVALILLGAYLIAGQIGR